MILSSVIQLSMHMYGKIYVINHSLSDASDREEDEDAFSY